MKLSDINNFKDAIINVLFDDLTKVSQDADEGSLTSKDEGKIFTLSFDGDLFHINCNKIHRNLRLKQKNQEIYDLFKRGITIVAELISYETTKLCFNIYPFYECLELGDTYIGVSDEIKNKLSKKGLKYSLENSNSNGNLLSELFLFEIDERQYFLFKSPDDLDFDYVDQYELTKNKNQKEHIKTEEKSKNEKTLDIPDFLKDVMQSPTIIEKKSEKEHRAFTLIGDGIRTPIKIEKNDDFIGASKLHVKQAIIKEYHNDERYGLAHGTLHFIDDSQSFKISSQLSAVMDDIYNSNDSYWKRWDQYCKYEMLSSLKGCHKFGYAKIVNVASNINGYTLYLDRHVNISNCVDGDEMVVSYELPNILENNTKSSIDNINEVIQDLNNINNEYRKASGSSHYTLLKKGLKNRTNYINVSCSESDLKPNLGFFVFLSITGNLKQHKRREIARKLIVTKQCGNPLLGKLLDDNENLNLLLSSSNDKKVDIRVNPLSERINKKIFSRNPPTPTQIKAIEIALNTPDIALIQGPPGTGKTTVITAIIERLNELNSKKDSIKGNILVSGFQHDAVENIIDRLSINSLPAVKFGVKRGTLENDSSTMHRIENWAFDIADKIRKNNPTVQISEEEKEWEYLVNEYLLSPSEENEIKILNGIINSNNSTIKKDTIIDEAKQLLNNYSFFEKDDEEIKHAINSLRTKKNSFADDGRDNCSRLLTLSEEYKDIFDDSDIELLSKAVNLSEEEIPVFLVQLEKLKEKLQYSILPKPKYTQPKINYRISSIANRMQQLLKNREENNNIEENQILVDFLSELENNPLGIRKSIEDYQLVYSATTQQSLSSSILEAKNGNLGRSYNEDNQFTNPQYDTVIIDEAARANPSDLLIPMVQAKKRIILVGDHRQLPHMIDENVVDAINSNEDINSDIYKVSMFEYLFHRLQKLEKLDGIQRTITLDAQYRTHPILGKFGSKLFYESHDSSEAYDSPLPENFFSQNLIAISGKCCTWFNVPNENNPMEKNSVGSSYRVAEAELCARCIKNWIDTPEANNLSFGIITFYSAQVQEIYKQLENYGIAEQNLQTNEFRIKEQYRYLNNGKERLRIGSVDAFQGMEFDIVLLSLVRTMSLSEIENTCSKQKNREKAINSIVGFLRMENRLCVSMSRQKRFLGIVGDSDFINSDICRENVPSLAKFYELCRTVGGVYKC